MNRFILFNKACYKIFWHFLTLPTSQCIYHFRPVFTGNDSRGRGVDFKYYVNNAVIPFLSILYLGPYTTS